MTDTSIYPLIKVLQQGNLVAIQPSSSTASPGSVETLSVNLQTGTVNLLQQPPITASSSISALGLLGLAKLQTGVECLLLPGNLDLRNSDTINRGVVLGTDHLIEWHY